jgi:hypothetical protein
MKAIANQFPACFVNPPASYLGRINAVLTGSSRSYHVAHFKGSLSIKTVVHGFATWETEGRRFLVPKTAGSC